LEITRLGDKTSIASFIGLCRARLHPSHCHFENSHVDALSFAATPYHFERSEESVFALLPADSRFLVAALLGMTSFNDCL